MFCIVEVSAELLTDVARAPFCGASLLLKVCVTVGLPSD